LLRRASKQVSGACEASLKKDKHKLHLMIGWILMKKPEFLKQQYISLREEIKETKSRIFKMASIGIVAMPSFYFLAKAYEIDVIILTLPIIICVLVLLYLSEMNAMMRCGRYIRTMIEPNVENIVGWEEWLEMGGNNEHDRRSVEKLVTYFFYVVFAIYYVASINLSAQYVGAKFGPEYIMIIYGVYIGLGIVFGSQLIKSWRVTISTNG
jgi:hypothetical protein